MGQTRAVLAQTSKIFSPNNNYDSVDSVGRVGKYQFNSVLLQNLGFLRDGTIEQLINVPGANAQAINAECNWTGLNQCNSVSNWKDDPGSQEQAILDAFALNAERLPKISAKFTALENNQKAGILLVSFVFGIQAARDLLNFFVGVSDSDPVDSRGYHQSMYYYAGSSAFDFGTDVENS
jgi:hypothetical protein